MKNKNRRELEEKLSRCVYYAIISGGCAMLIMLFMMALDLNSDQFIKVTTVDSLLAGICAFNISRARRFSLSLRG